MSARRRRRNPPFGLAEQLGVAGGPGEATAARGPTELTDYLGVIRDRLPILILLPTAAVLVVTALVLIGPKNYRASATVAGFSLVSGDDVQFNGQNGARQFADTLVGIVDSGAVATRVGERTHIEPREVARQLSASAIGTNGLARISYTTRRRSEAPVVVQAAAEESLRLVFKADVSQRLADEAAKNLERIQAETDKLLADSQLGPADVDAELARQQITTLENNLIAAQAELDSAGAARYSAALASKREALKAHTAAIRSYEALNAERDQTIDRLAKARSALDQANARVAAIHTANVMSVSRARVVSPVEEVLRKGGLAVGVATFLAVGIVVATEMAQVRGVRRPARGRTRRAPARV